MVELYSCLTETNTRNISRRRRAYFFTFSALVLLFILLPALVNIRNAPSTTVVGQGSYSVLRFHQQTGSMSTPNILPNINRVKMELIPRRRLDETVRRAGERRRQLEYDYDEIQKKGIKHKSYKDKYITDFSSFDSYTSPDVLRYGCNLTTVILEPRMPTADFTDSAWFAVESLATYVSYSCVVIQTSSCSVLPPKAGKKSPPMSKQIEEVTKEIYERALPMFRGMMERGLVRISILDHEKYQLPSCTDFYTPSNAWMSVNYWKDEFIDNVDNEMILIMQIDGVICRDFDVNLWKDLAFVGAPWAPSRWYGGVVCDELREKFDIWTSYRPKPRMVPHPVYEPAITNAVSSEALDLKLKNLCTNGYGAGFNGGIVLRNSTWMLRAIEACPSKTYSGISLDGKKCAIEDEAEEDEYFALILSSLGAPLPTAYEAALFGVETFFAEQAREYYGPYKHSEIEAFLAKRWGKDGLAKYERMHLRKTYNMSYEDSENDLASSTLRTIPVTAHCPWKYHPDDITTKAQMREECKFLRFVM